MIRTLTIVISLALMPLAAEAHAFLDEAVPKVGSSVSAPPKEIRITYTQPVEPAFSHIQLYDGQGQQVATGTAATDPANPQVLIVPVTGAMAPGHYEVKWDVVSVDTHHTDGHFPFDFTP
jgi:methionine-rich copper-binding protein CopC